MSTFNVKYDTTEKGDHKYAIDNDNHTIVVMKKVFDDMKAFAAEKNGGYPMVEVSFFPKMGTIKNPRAYKLYACPTQQSDKSVVFRLPVSGRFKKYHDDPGIIATSSITAAQIVLGITSYLTLKDLVDKEIITEDKEKKAVAAVLESISDKPDLIKKLNKMIKQIFKKGVVNGNIRRQQYGLNSKFVIGKVVFRSMPMEDRELVFTNSYGEMFKWSEDRFPFIANLADLVSYEASKDATPFVFGTKKEKSPRGSKESAKKAKLSNADLRDIMDGIHNVIAKDPRNKDLNCRAFSLLSLGEKIRDSAVIKAGETQFSIIFKNKSAFEDGEDKEKKDKKKEKRKKRKERDDDTDSKKKNDDDEDENDGGEGEAEEKDDSTDNGGDSHMGDPGDAESSDSETSDMESSSSDSDEPSDPIDVVPDKTSPKKPYNTDFYKNTEYADTASLKSVVMKSFKNSTLSEHISVESPEESVIRSVTPHPSPRQQEEVCKEESDVVMNEAMEECEVSMPNSPSMNMIPVAKPDCSTSVSVPSPCVAELVSPCLVSPAISEFVPVQTPNPTAVPTPISEPQSPPRHEEFKPKPIDPLTEKVLKITTMANNINQQVNDAKLKLQLEAIDQNTNQKIKGLEQEIKKDMAAVHENFDKVQARVDKIAEQTKETQEGIMNILNLLQQQNQRTTDVQTSVNNYVQKPDPKTLNPGPLFGDILGMPVRHPLHEFDIFD